MLPDHCELSRHARQRLDGRLQNWLKLAAAPLIAVPLSMTAPAWAGTLTTVHDFAAGADGVDPNGPIAIDVSGNIFGTTPAGGASDEGTVWEVPQLGAGAEEQIVYSFTGGAAGGAPVALTLGIDGKTLYVVTATGGAMPANGAVIALSPPKDGGTSYTASVIHSFQGPSDGRMPQGGVIEDSAGDLFGTTTQGGGQANVGVVYELAPAEGGFTETILHSFQQNDKGSVPFDKLLLDSGGTLYGPTSLGFGPATVFALTSSGTYSVVHSFAADGPPFSYPNSTLIANEKGALIGTQAGGPDGKGAVFKLVPPASSGGTWTKHILYAFIGGIDGREPMGPLLRGADDVLYGTTVSAGQHGYGVLYQLKPPASGETMWRQKVLYAFTGSADGGHPNGHLSLVGGSLFGTTSYGGNGYGTVYKFTP